jgi:DNA-binding XRE family transcriptional regulator
MDLKILGENLKRLREKHSLTQEALAESLGIPELAVYKWEAGRLPLEYKALARIADFFDVTIESILDDQPVEERKPAASDKVTFNCRICGGKLVYNCSGGDCRCANCGNKWSIAELYPKYARVMATINKANDILNSKTVLASADEAKLLFGQAKAECEKFNDALSPELVNICNEGQKRAEQLEIYCRGKHFFDNKAYKSAAKELEKVRGFRDADEMIQRCNKPGLKKK